MDEQEEGYFTEEERKKYQESIEKMFVPIGVNIFDLIEQDDIMHLR